MCKRLGVMTVAAAALDLLLNYDTQFKILTYYIMAIFWEKNDNIWQFFKKMSSFWHFFDIQMAIFWRVRF